MKAFTPQLELETLFVLDENRRIISTREPTPRPGPRFFLIRGTSSCAWAIHADVPDDVAAELGKLASEEPPTGNFRSEPVFAKGYASLVGGRLNSGPAFTFPDAITSSDDSALIENVTQLEHNFRGWTADEIPERSPILAIIEEGEAVSICFCARRSAIAAEAGVETAQAFRGRGLAPRVAAAWARAIRASARLPLYSTSWSNDASLAVARKLSLNVCACHWSLSP